MKKAILILSICGLVLVAISADAAQKLLFSTFASAFVADDVTEAVLREAYERIGIGIAVEKFPDKRALSMADKGVTDGELFRIANIGKDYPNLIMIPVPVSFFEGVAFTKNAD